MDTDCNRYECLPIKSTFSNHMLAGAVAGMMEHSVMYPVDCIKTRMQTLVPDPKADYRSLLDAANRIVRYEGIRSTMRGFSAMVAGAGPAHALYFACYEEMKRTLSGGKSGNHLANVIKQRMQMYSTSYKTCFQCGRQVLRSEGIWAFYRSYSTQLVMNVPFQAVQFIVYEMAQEQLNPCRLYDPLTHMASGAVAGASAAAVTMPFDACKTLLNTQEVCVTRQRRHGGATGTVSALRTIYRCHGMGGFFRGTQARIVYQVPSTAISWSMYELLKFVLSRWREPSVGGSLLTGTAATMSPVLSGE